MGIINNNVATEITYLQKNMVALKNLSPSKNLAPTYPLRVHSPLIFGNLAPKAIFFSAPYPPFCQGRGVYSMGYTSSRNLQAVFKMSSKRLQDVLQRSLQGIFKMFSRRPQNVFKMYHQVKLLYLTYLQYIFKMYSTCFEAYCEDDYLQKDLPRSHFLEIYCQGTNFPRMNSLDIPKLLK